MSARRFYSGVCLMIYGADGKRLYSAEAHAARAGWANYYLGTLDGTPYLLSVHIEDRDDLGGYSYRAFRLREQGELLELAGSAFEWGINVRYDDEQCHEWADQLAVYLKNSHLLLSSQEGELRTEPVCEAEKYNYSTLRKR